MRMFHSIFLLSLTCLAQTPAPIIYFNKTHHDFCKILQNKKVSYKYEVINNGNAPLQIREIRSSCGCAYSLFGQKRLMPNENHFIEVCFDSTGLRGTIYRSLEVISNDPANPSLALTFEANIIREIEPSMSIVNFNKISRDSLTYVAIRLESGNGQPVDVIETEVPDVPFLSYKTQKDGNDVILKITIDGQFIPKYIYSGKNNLTVRTASDKIPTLSFIIQWNLQTPISATPDKIILHDTAGKELRVTVNLKHADGKPFGILEAKSNSSLISAYGFKKVRVAEQQFDVVISSKAKAGGYREILTLLLDDPEQRELKMDIAVALR
jgi:hypothetical protein